ncbi:MAG: hypothetical protein CVV25_09060 [Ignavibacteriae bacterium HGW-Ignavibacteriae-4]|nr:MAG: hypothetical protein CVV25_09060 [Ignavibacteriae bacterium HGW-Ignavibacteriae-4]
MQERNFKVSEINTISDYIATFVPEIQSLLNQMRETISKAAPDAEECISYAIPTYKLHGNLVHFAAAKSHIGFYPAPSAILHFTEELAGFKSAKGSVQFPCSQPLPLELITKIVKFRVQENLAKKKK